MKNRIYRRGEIAHSLAAFVIVCAVYTTACICCQITPFGSYSILVMDCRIQYVQFLMYFRDVLLGNQSLVYAFSNGLGDTCIGLYGYYLASPLNLLLVFFQDDQLETFVWLVTMIRLGLCSVTYTIYLRQRFEHLDGCWTVILGVAFGLCQYVIAQESNIMWLDGVVMLPLIALGVWRLVQGRSARMYCITLALAIMFCWYTGYMDVLFSAFYFIYEWLLAGKGRGLRAFLGDFVRLIAAMLVALCMSAVLFLPVLDDLIGGKSSIRSIFNPGVTYNLLDLPRRFAIGSTYNKPDSISLYCGILTFLLAASYFVSKKVQRRDRVVTGIFLGVLLLSAWSILLDGVWNGFRTTESYYFRYSYVMTFFVIVIAARSAAEADLRGDAKKIAVIALVFAALAIVYELLEPSGRKYPVVATVGFSVAYALCWLVYGRAGAGKQPSSGKQMLWVFAVLVIAELAANACFVMKYIYDRPQGDYSEYVANQNEQCDGLRAYDTSSFYRVEQTSELYMYSNGLTASFDDGMAYRFSCISEYSSVLNESSFRFVSKLGYYRNALMTIYDQSILSSDSLLGVKYVLADSPLKVQGMNAVTQLDSYNGKTVYENPYALPLGFGVDGGAVGWTSDEANPFEYQNKLYSALLGKDVTIFKPVAATAKVEDGSVVVTVEPGDADGYVYGCADLDREAVLSVNGTAISSYNCWLSYYVFNVGAASQQNTVSFGASDASSLQYSYSFYELDMAAFEDAISELSASGASMASVSDGNVGCSYSSQGDGYVLFTIPFDSRWHATVNGEEVACVKAADDLMAVPVSSGSNEIVLSYRRDDIWAGLVVSILAAIMLAAFGGKWRLNRRDAKPDGI